MLLLKLKFFGINSEFKYVFPLEAERFGALPFYVGGGIYTNSALLLLLIFATFRFPYRCFSSTPKPHFYCTSLDISDNHFEQLAKDVLNLENYIYSRRII